jgi:hypothetical protein
MSEINQAHALSFLARIGNHDTKDERKTAGTRAFEIAINFVRTAFGSIGRNIRNGITRG